MMNVNKTMRLGSLFFTIVLFAFSSIKYLYEGSRTSIYYFIAAVGFLIVSLSYKKKEKNSK